MSFLLGGKYEKHSDYINNLCNYSDYMLQKRKIKMLKTCSHCGIVSSDHICPYSKRKKKYSLANDIRKTNKWHLKSKEIKERDNYLCRICILNLYNTVYKFNTETLETHHIIPINEDDTKAFDDFNLITLCNYHHDMADKGDIPREFLLKIVKENIRTSPPGLMF